MPGVCAVEKSHAQTGTVEIRTEWTYDEAGREVTGRQTFNEEHGVPDGRWEVDYDAQGHSVETRSYQAGWEDPHTVTRRSYDHCGRLARHAWDPLRPTEDGDVHPAERTYTYSEVEGGHQAVERYEVDGALDVTTTRRWDAAGRLLEERRELPDGEVQRVETYVWDGDLLTDIDWTTNLAWRFAYEAGLVVREDELRGDAVSRRTTYTRDDQGHITERLAVRGEAGDEERRDTFGYDDQGRLVRVEWISRGEATWVYALEWDCPGAS